MKPTSNNKTYTNIIVIISFFLYSGYYSFLALIIASGNTRLSTYYSVPLRFVLMFLMIYLIVKSPKLKKHKIVLVLFIVLSIFYIIKVFYSEIFFSSIYLSRNWYEYILYYLSYSFFPFITFCLIDFKKYSNIIINPIIFSGFLLGLVSLLLFKDVYLSGGIGRISQLSYETEQDVISPLALSYSGILTLSLCVFKLLYTKVDNFKIKVYLFITIFLSLMLFYLGATRGSFIGLILCLFALLYFNNFSSKLKIIAFALLSIPVLTLGAELTGSAIFKRMDSTVESGNTSDREPLYLDAYNEFVQNPLFGGRIEVSGIYPHNIFLEILMSMGIIGIGLFLFIILYCYSKGANSINHDKTYIAPMFIFIIGFTMSNFSGSIYAAIMLFAPLGMLFNNKIKL